MCAEVVVKCEEALDADSGGPAGDLQVPADHTLKDSLYGSLVPLILVFFAQSRRTACGTLFAG
jgi:hypothetical protein